MLKVGLLCGVIAAMSVTGAKVSNDKKFESKELNAQFILELKDDIDSISAEKAIKEQNAVFNRIKSSVNKNATLDKNFTLLNNCFAISANEEDIDALRKLPNVAHVTQNGTHIVKKSQGSMISLDISKKNRAPGVVEENASAVTMNKPEGTNEGEGTLIAVLDNEFYLRGIHQEEGETKPAYYHETYTALPAGTKTRLNFTDVSHLYKTHARGYADGEDLGGYVNERGVEGSFYFNNKVPFYFDYAGDTWSGGSYGAKPDFNVESTVDLHGSHVSSIAAGNADTYKGIAPKAQLVLMKVFTDIHKTDASDAAKMGEYGRFNELAFIEALEDCIQIGVDAINVSIGSDLADFEEGTISQRTLQKITDKGILSSISAGNSGKMSYASLGGYANWTKDMVETGIMGSFANNRSTMTIAAGQPETTFYENSIELAGNVVPYDDQVVNREGQAKDYPDNEHRLVELINGGIVDPENDEFEPTPEEQETEIPYEYLNGFGESNDYKNKNVSHKIVVVNRGKIAFSEKYENAAGKGAAGLIIINNDPTEQDFTFRCDFGDSAKSIKFPIVVALFTHKPIFAANPSGTFKIRRNTSSDNKLKRTISDFSTDGATYDLDLKPEITAPGSNIKGAVWPQTKLEKKEENKYRSYEYFNGTSMSAPNFEGAMSVVLSKVAKEGTIEDIKAERKLLDMKMMSTAVPMHDYYNPDEYEPGEIPDTITSPRMQGAGMANIEGAYNTDVYLEGFDSKDGKANKKAKIVLRNNEDIAKGDIKLSFIAHNEGSSDRTYSIKYNVMRPAVALSNKVLSKDYHNPVEVDSVKSIPGFYFFSPEQEEMIHAEGSVNYKDVIKVSRDIQYYQSEDEYFIGTDPETGEPIIGEPQGVLKEGMYYWNAKDAKDPQVDSWEEVPMSEYQSIKDEEIAEVDCGTITVHGYSSEKFTLNTYSLTKEQKDEIQRLYEAGTYIEGYISLTAQGDFPDLSMPYMGFYSLADRVNGATYDNAPVVEPFSFEKDPTKFYGSDLANDVAKSLVGKDNADMGSMMVTGYAKNIDDINTEAVLTNDDNFAKLKGFYPVATKPDPYSQEEIDNPSQNIYLGNPQQSNTLIIQQFVYRSVKDNYFTITNKNTHKEVYRSALEDSLYGDTAGKYALYKSHVDGSYIGAGYIAHRAWALVPLYDVRTKVSFASGEYELKFNYQLAGTDNWVSKAYTLHIDSETPVIKSISEFTKDGVDMVRLTYKDTKVAYAIIGSNQVEVKYDKNEKVFYSEVKKSLLDSALSQSSETSLSKSRVLIKVVDYARGETTAICHFGKKYSDFVIAQGTEFTINHDFRFENGKVRFIEVDEEGNENEYKPTYSVKVSVGGSGSTAEGTGTNQKKGFFAAIAEFFRKIGEWFASLFKK